MFVKIKLIFERKVSFFTFIVDFAELLIHSFKSDFLNQKLCNGVGKN